MTLTDNDRQRIEQEVRKLCYEWEPIFPLLMRVAEYATIYEREQQAKLQQESDIKQRALEINAKTIMKLEAERSELRNKVIEEVIEKLCVSVEFGYLERHWETLLIELNSLKTK